MTQPDWDVTLDLVSKPPESLAILQIMDPSTTGPASGLGSNRSSARLSDSQCSHPLFRRRLAAFSTFGGVFRYQSGSDVPG